MPQPEANDPLVVERSVLDCGAELVRQPTPPGAASFSLTYLGPAGWGYEPRGHAGLALLVSELVSSGAGRLDRAALARQLDRQGATLASQCHPESTELTLWGPEEHFAALLPIFVDAVRRPRFEAKEIRRLRRQIAERQLREGTQPDRRVEKELFRQIFPAGHPYRETGLGTPGSIGRIRPEDLRNFHRKHFTPAGGALVATCRRPAARLRRELDRAIGDWSGVAPAPPRVLAPPRTRGRAPLEISLAGGSQVEVRMGGPSLRRADPEYSAATLANEVLGGRAMMSRLPQNLRERSGLVYHAGSELEAMGWGGFWSAEAGTDPTKVAEVLRRLRAEIQGLGALPVPHAELDRIRESLIGSVVLELETTASAHELAVEIAYHHLAPDYARRWPEELRALRPEQVQAAAAKHLDARAAATVVAGPLTGGRARPPSKPG